MLTFTQSNTFLCCWKPSFLYLNKSAWDVKLYIKVKRPLHLCDCRIARVFHPWGHLVPLSLKLAPLINQINSEKLVKSLAN